jgi:long-chain acyl-CoA synthetase
VPHTFQAVAQASGGIGAALQRMGLTRGDRVVLMMENSLELVAAIFGVLEAGGVFVVVHPTTKAEKLSYILTDCEARFVVAGSRLARVVIPAVRDAPAVNATFWAGGVPDADPAGVALDTAAATGEMPRASDVIDADLAAIVYTSGSTGGPKGVMLTHANVCHNAWSISTYLGVVPDDVVACLLPMSFDYGLFQVLMGARVGYTTVLERSFAYPYEAMERLARHRVTVLPGVPTIFATILPMAPFDGLDLSRIRMLTNTAAALPPAHIRRLQQLFPQARLFSMYGLTECTRVSYLDPERLHDKVTSVGKAMPNTEAYVVDETGRRVPPGVVGELVVRGASVMRGYWGKPEETAKCLRDGEIQGEKVLFTGDRFRADEEGFLYFVGRTDDIFKCKGEKVSPREIEHVLYELEAVREAAVVGVEDEVDGTAIKAIVATSDPEALDERVVRNHCRARLESYLVPKHVEIRTELPKTESGKIKRAAVARGSQG